MKVTTISILLGAVIFSVASFADQEPGKTVDEVKLACINFFKACEDNDRPTIKSSFAQLTPETPAEFINYYVEGFTRENLFANEKVGETKVVKNKAVIAYWSDKKDLDPIYFVREGDDWKILITLTQYNEKCYSWSESDLREFDELKAWFTAYKSEHLYKR